MQILLAVTMLFGLVWFVALRPKPDVATESSIAPAVTAPAQGTGAPPAAPAPSASSRAASGADRAAARSGGGDAAARSGGAAPARHAAAARDVRRVRTALHDRKAVAIAFVDPRVADARAVAQEVRHVSGFHGRAISLAVPLSQLSDFAFITREVEVTVAPTVVIVDRRHRASTIVGFADRGEIEQRLADALAAKPKR